MADDAGDAEMVHYETDDEDDVDTINNNAKARPQQGSTVEKRSRRSFAGASREVPFKLRLNLTLALALALTLTSPLRLMLVTRCSTRSSMLPLLDPE